MIDCGADWLKRLPCVAPTAIVITHAHPDHAFGPNSTSRFTACSLVMPEIRVASIIHLASQLFVPELVSRSPS